MIRSDYENGELRDEYGTVDAAGPAELEIRKKYKDIGKEEALESRNRLREKYSAAYERGAYDAEEDSDFDDETWDWGMHRGDYEGEEQEAYDLGYSEIKEEMEYGAPEFDGVSSNEFGMTNEWGVHIKFTEEERDTIRKEHEQRIEAFDAAEKERKQKQREEFLQEKRYMFEKYGQSLFIDYDEPTDLNICDLNNLARPDNDEDVDLVNCEEIPPYITGRAITLGYNDTCSHRDGDTYILRENGVKAGSFEVIYDNIAVVPDKETLFDTDGVVVKGFKGRVTISHTLFGRLEVIGDGTPSFELRYERDWK